MPSTTFAARLAFESSELSESERADVQALLKIRLEYLLHLAEIGLAVPQSSQRLN